MNECPQVGNAGIHSSAYYEGETCQFCGSTEEITEHLSDDELEALGKDGNWDTRYGERAIKELRGLRARVAMLDSLAEGNGLLFDEVVALREKVAKLRAALRATEA